MLVRNWIVCIMVFSTRVSREEHPTDEKHHQPYAFVDYVKAKKSYICVYYAQYLL